MISVGCGAGGAGCEGWEGSEGSRELGVDNPNLGRSVLCYIEAKFSEVKYFQKGFEIDKVDTLLHRSKLSFRIFTHNLGEQIQKDFAILR